MTKPIVRGKPVAWLAFYKTARWQRLRQWQLRQEPLCKLCLEHNRVILATVADHVEPHRGDWNAFCTGKLQSLCKACHDSAKRHIELHGYRADTGLDGYPVDLNHPFNRARQAGPVQPMNYAGLHLISETAFPERESE